MSYGLYVIVFAWLLLVLTFLFRRQLFPSVSIGFAVQCGSDHTKARYGALRADLDRAYLQDYFRSFAVDTKYNMAKARLRLTSSLKTLREKRKPLEASMRQVERFLYSRYRGFNIVSGSLLIAVQREAKLEENEADFVRAHYALHGCVAKVQSYLKDLRELQTQLRTWMNSDISEELQVDAQRLIVEIDAECDSVIPSIDIILSEADSEPVGVSEGNRASLDIGDYRQFSSVVGSWRQQRAEARSRIHVQ